VVKFSYDAKQNNQKSNLEKSRELYRIGYPRDDARSRKIRRGQSRSGFPDFAAPEDIKRKAMEAIDDDYNQYAITWGVKSFRDAIAAKTKRFLVWTLTRKRKLP
jgi:aspartate/methionine/tyrosine aminotransferase